MLKLVLLPLLFIGSSISHAGTPSDYFWHVGKGVLSEPLYPGPTLDCSYIPSPIPAQERISTLENAWIVEVLDVSTTQATVKVLYPVRGEHRLTGTIQSITWLPESKPCVVPWQKNERWLYGGPLRSDPTFKLDASISISITQSSVPDTTQGPSLQMDKFCDRHSQCDIGYLDCDSFITVHKELYPNALHWWKKRLKVTSPETCVSEPKAIVDLRWPVCDIKTHACSVLELKR